ncbi:hypothetical protein EDB84DRAFT_1568016 [Lactarius hengduanensis]|nr:hypothetical protein EDB84DRAFT_1568016 [Lactarius hengduanensis]
MVSQRRLFAFVPGIRPEAAHAAASTPVPPKECAVYFAQAAAPQLAHDCAPGRAKPSQRPQAPVPVVEARVSMAPSAHAASPSVHAASPNARDTSQVPCSNYKPACVMPSGSVPSSSRAVPPKRPQSAPCVSHTAHVIQSRPRWPRSHLPHRMPARAHQRAQCPPTMSFCTPHPMHSVSPRNKPHDIKPSYEQPATRYRATAPQSPSHSSKPPDVVRQACVMPAQLSSSDPATFKTHDATSARTPAMYAKTLSNHSASYKRLQPARRRAWVPQCNCNDHAICRGSPYGCRDISNRATFAQAPAPLPRRHARQQRRKNNQEQPHQVASSVKVEVVKAVKDRSGPVLDSFDRYQFHRCSSADPTASAPQLRGGSHVAIEF